MTSNLGKVAMFWLRVFLRSGNDLKKQGVYTKIKILTIAKDACLENTIWLSLWSHSSKESKVPLLVIMCPVGVKVAYLFDPCKMMNVNYSLYINLGFWFPEKIQSFLVPKFWSDQSVSSSDEWKCSWRKTFVCNNVGRHRNITIFVAMKHNLSREQWSNIDLICFAPVLQGHFICSIALILWFLDYVKLLKCNSNTPN